MEKEKAVLYNIYYIMCLFNYFLLHMSSWFNEKVIGILISADFKTNEVNIFTYYWHL